MRVTNGVGEVQLTLHANTSSGLTGGGGQYMYANTNVSVSACIDNRGVYIGLPGFVEPNKKGLGTTYTYVFDYSLNGEAALDTFNYVLYDLVPASESMPTDPSVSNYEVWNLGLPAHVKIWKDVNEDPFFEFPIVLSEIGSWEKTATFVGDRHGSSSSTAAHKYKWVSSLKSLTSEGLLPNGLADALPDFAVPYLNPFHLERPLYRTVLSEDPYSIEYEDHDNDSVAQENLSLYYTWPETSGPSTVCHSKRTIIWHKDCETRQTFDNDWLDDNIAAGWTTPAIDESKTGLLNGWVFPMDTAYVSGKDISGKVWDIEQGATLLGIISLANTAGYDTGKIAGLAQSIMDQVGSEQLAEIRNKLDWELDYSDIIDSYNFGNTPWGDCQEISFTGVYPQGCDTLHDKWDYVKHHPSDFYWMFAYRSKKWLKVNLVDKYDLTGYSGQVFNIDGRDAQQINPNTTHRLMANTFYKLAFYRGSSVPDFTW